MGVDSVNEDNLILCNGCICCNNALYTEFPACIGCSGEYKLLCLECAFCLKLNTKQLRFIICDINVVKDYMPIWKHQDQCFCCVDNCSIPPSKEVPATLGIYGLFIYPSIGCCRTQKAVVMGRA